VRFVDNLRTTTFKSPYDGSERELLVSLPVTFKTSRSYPLVVSPHPFGWSHFENYAKGAADLLEPFRGWAGISEKYQVVIALPFGHGRALERVSLGWEAQIEDLAAMPRILEEAGVRVKSDKVYIAGLSMGGLETLTALGKHPDTFRAGVCFNGISDLAAFYDDVVSGVTDQKLRDMGVAKVVAEEVGGTPEQQPDEYRRRSAVNYVDALATTNLMIYWSSRESAVTNQESKQTRHLCDEIKAKNPDANVHEHDHSFEHGFSRFDGPERIRCHEFCDFERAAHWLLNY
jgi:dipeptidyl aminopeptidase/acylaminoacyl peptidase